MTTALNAALAYADRGWHVFPVQPPPNKKPVTEHGFLEATTDHAQIVAWWSEYPSAQVGVACGASGLCPVDLDEKPKEWISGKASLDTIGVDADTCCNLVMSTPRNGGRQLFFMAFDTLRRIKVLPGVDLLGGEGYSILPSPASPNREWIVGDPFDTDDLDPLPEWAAKLMGSSRPASAKSFDARLFDKKETPIDPDQACDIVRAMSYICNDSRDDWLKVGMAMKSTGAKEQAFKLWTDWSMCSPSGDVHPSYNAADQRYQWDRLHALKMDGSEITLGTLFHMAKEGGWVQESEPAVEFEVKTLTETKQRIESPALKSPSKTSPQAPQIELDRTDAKRSGEREPLLKPDKVQLSDWTDVAKLPPIEWQIEDLIPRASLTVLAGDTGAAKSFVLIDIAMRLVHDLPFQGLPIEAGSVIYLCGEGQQGLAARFRAWEKHHAYLGLDAGDRYCVVSSEIPVLAKNTIDSLSELIAFVTEWKGHAPAMTIVDTLSQGLDDDENESKVVSPVIRGLMALRKRWGCSIVLAHHLVKMQQQGKRKGQEPTKDSVRGSGAITRNVDTVLGLTLDENKAGPRHLHVWKQKDGLLPESTPVWLLPVLTGGVRSNGDDETSCIIVPDSGYISEPEKPQEPRVEDPTQPNPEAIKLHEAAISRVVATLESAKATEGPGGLGGMSGKEVVQQAGMKRDRIYAAISGAEREGRIKNVGTARAPRWMVPKEPGTTESPKASEEGDTP